VIEKHAKSLDSNAIEEQLLRELSIEFKPDRNRLEENSAGVSDELYTTALAYYRRKEEAVPADIMRQIEKYAVLSVIDKQWRDHLREIDTLREGINLRAYGQKDPLLEYKQEAYNLFIQMLSEIELETLSLAFKLFPINPEEAREIEERQKQAAVRQEKLVTQHEEAGSVYNASQETHNEAPPQRPVTADAKPGRNDPCPCGSGKKIQKLSWPAALNPPGNT